MDASALKRRLGRVWTYRWTIDIDGARYDVRLESGWRRNSLVVATGGVDIAREDLDFYAEPFRMQEVVVARPNGGPLAFRSAPRTFYSYGFEVAGDGGTIHRSHPEPFGALAAMQKLSNFGNSADGKRQAEKSRELYPALATDFAVGMMLYFAAGYMSLRNVAILGAAVMLSLMVVDWAADRLLSRKLNLTAGLSGLGVLMLLLSAGFAWLVDNDLAIQLKSSVLGLIAALLFAIDAMLGGRYLGERTVRYITFVDLDPRRFSSGTAIVTAGQSLLSGSIALWLSRDTWLFYKHWIWPLLGITLAALVLWKARKPAAPLPA